MRLVKLGPDGPWVERHDIDRCQNPDCGIPFGPGRFHLGHLNCECAGTHAHRTFKCRTCGHLSHDPPHDPNINVPSGHQYFQGTTPKLAR